MKRNRCAVAAAALLMLLFSVLAELPANDSSEEMPILPPEPNLAAYEASGIDLLQIDHKLYELGYRDAACNGKLDEVTLRALRNFQLANALVVTGEPDEDTVQLLLYGNPLTQQAYLESLARQNMDSAALTIGAYGDTVERLQRQLQRAGYFEGSPSGMFDEATQEAVCLFQLANGLPISGIADGSVLLRLYQVAPISLEAFLLSCCVKVGDSGDAVHTVQQRLKALGFFEGETTGNFGDETRRAIRLFRSANEMEPADEVDLACARALFDDMRSAMPGRKALREGDSGADVEQLCQSLRSLGYPASSGFDMQTELALMQFQTVCGMDVNGIADELCVARLRAETAPRREDYQPIRLVMPPEEELGARIARYASRLPGRASALETEFSLVQYVYMKCGIPLMDISQLTPIATADMEDAREGEIIRIELKDGELTGIVTADHALIYRDDSGFIVMGYPESMGAIGYTLYRLGA